MKLTLCISYILLQGWYRCYYKFFEQVLAVLNLHVKCINTIHRKILVWEKIGKFGE